MLRVESISIEEFRGIRNLKLNLRGENFAVCGLNGTGKSGVVDALEFALTGAVSRLAGDGMGDVSLATHGPHVVVSGHPEKSKVIVKLSLPSLRKTATVERSLKYPKKPKITPHDPDIAAVLKDIEQHPEVVLSRRQIIKYVLAPPSTRAKQVQELLRLESLNKVRASLGSLARASEKAVDPLEAGRRAAKENLLRALGVPELSSERLLAAVNGQRSILGLPAITELKDSTAINDGLEAPPTGGTQRIAKVQATLDLKAAKQSIDEYNAPATKAKAGEAIALINQLLADPSIATSAARETFYESGAKLIVDESCPFCDLPWESAKLRAHLQEKIEQLKEITATRRAIAGAVAPLIEIARQVRNGMSLAIQHAKLADPPFDYSELQKLSDLSASQSQSLGALHRLPEAKAALESLCSAGTARTVLLNLGSVVQALPEPSKQDAARVWLAIAQERLGVYREARRAHEAGKVKAQTTKTIFAAFTESMDKVLKDIYSSVQNDFVAYYRFINNDDEKDFTAKLSPAEGALDLDVSFYEFGFFPPGAYHSEGHQDGMGLCLYLALMRKLHGALFTFAVLDDVLMSVDFGHRRKVCALLKKEFPNTQFVMTTHDKVWLRNMRTEGLIKPRAEAHFRAWNVHFGPTQWDDFDVWAEIDADLAKGDVQSAAASLRHYLEYETAELCNRLRARVQYRSDAQYQLGELMYPAIAQMKELFKQGKKAASSFGNTALVAELSAKEAAFDLLARRATNDEYWYVNPAVHYNEWENLTPADLIPVVSAFKDLLGDFVCAKCSQSIWVSPEREQAQSVQCGCGAISISLIEKKK